MRVMVLDGGCFIGSHSCVARAGQGHCLDSWRRDQANRVGYG